MGEESERRVFVGSRERCVLYNVGGRRKRSRILRRSFFGEKMDLVLGIFWTGLDLRRRP